MIYESVRGKIISEWKIEDDCFILNAVIPEDIDAVVILPDGTKTEHAGSGIYSCKM